MAASALPSGLTPASRSCRPSMVQEAMAAIAPMQANARAVRINWFEFMAVLLSNICLVGSMPSVRHVDNVAFRLLATHTFGRGVGIRPHDGCCGCRLERGGGGMFVVRAGHDALRSGILLAGVNHTAGEAASHVDRD